MAPTLLRHLLRRAAFSTRTYSTARPTISGPRTLAEIQASLKTPSWSILAALPSHNPQTLASLPDISEKTLHHLLNLSALPLPRSKEETEKMLRDLKEQLAFVKAVQSVDTEGVEPLAAVRDGNVKAWGVEILEEVEAGEGRSERIEDVMGAGNVGGGGRKRVGRFVVVKGKKGEEDEM